MVIDPVIPFTTGSNEGRVLERLLDRLKAHKDVLAVYAGGSLARGDGDVFSDIDLVVVVADGWPSWEADLNEIDGVVFRRAQSAPVRLENLITSNWVRCDIVTLTTDQVEDYAARAHIRPLFIANAEAYSINPPKAKVPDRGVLLGHVHEFVRVLGLTPVVLGRDEPVLALTGLTLMRLQFIGLLVAAASINRGALRLRGVISEADIQILASLPLPPPERDAILRSTAVYATAFGARARQLFAEFDLAWPEAFTQATVQRLQTALDLTIEI